jgi:hypothetical protein
VYAPTAQVQIKKTIIILQVAAVVDTVVVVVRLKLVVAFAVPML